MKLATYLCVLALAAIALSAPLQPQRRSLDGVVTDTADVTLEELSDILKDLTDNLKDQMKKLKKISPEGAYVKAQQEIRKINRMDAKRLEFDTTGLIFVVEDAIGPAAVRRRSSGVEAKRIRRFFSATPTGTGADGVPIFHSLPGSTNVIYLDFSGMTISGTSWNTNTAPTLVALPFDLDGNRSSFSAAERAAITSVWSRVAEDYAPFNIDVTTEQPATFTPTTGRVVITRSVDANGVNMPSPTSGGVAYINVFGTSNYINWASPALVYYNNIVGREDLIAEACSHEMGHNLGLTHDGVGGTTPSGYYTGAGTGDASWAPIMGQGYNRAVTQFSNGDYSNANNFEDDLAIIASKVGYRPDDNGNTIATATSLALGGGSFSRDGIIERNTDADVFAIGTGGGLMNITVTPFYASTNTRGNNLDILAQLTDAAGNVLAVSNPANSSSATIRVTLATAGIYYLWIDGSSNGATPYSQYGSLGQYAIVGSTSVRRVNIFTASMSTAASISGWTFTDSPSIWAQGTSSCANKPRDRPILGTVISGSCLYPEPLASSTQIITPTISTVGYTSVTVSFDRYLGVSADDTANVRICKTTCANVWSNGGTAIADKAWVRVSYTLDNTQYANTSFKLRFGVGVTAAGANGVSTANSGWAISNLVVSGVPV